MLGQFIVPDWREAKQYPDPKKATPSRWAWEFLRRNQSYQADWDYFAALVQETADKHPETKSYVDWYLTRAPEAHAKLRTRFKTDESYSAYINDSYSSIFDDRENALNVFTPPRNKSETYKEYRARLLIEGVSKCSRCPMASALGKTWGLNDIHPPQSDTVGFFGANFSKKLGSGFFMPNIDKRDFLRLLPKEKRGEAATDLLNDMGERLGKPQLETITFDLTMPLDEQVRGALSLLKATRKHMAKENEISPIEQQQYQVGLYAQYLRAYDANLKGVKPSEVAKVLRPNDENNTANGYGASTKISTWVKRAEELVAKDYRFIPLAANSAAKRKPKKTVNGVKKRDSKS